MYGGYIFKPFLTLDDRKRGGKIVITRIAISLKAKNYYFTNCILEFEGFTVASLSLYIYMPLALNFS